MTTIKIIKRNSNIIEVDACGHSGYADYGKDIVCAAISAIIQTACLGVERQIGKNAKIKIDENQGKLNLKIAEISDKNKINNVNIILETMVLGLKDIAKSNKKYVKLEEEDEIY